MSKLPRLRAPRLFVINCQNFSISATRSNDNRIASASAFSNSDYDVWTYSLAEKRATPFAAVRGSAQHSSRFSPDGRWIAYVSAESGRLEVYVQAFAGAQGSGL